MFETGDTIVAIATPPGRGGIGVVRVSGPLAPSIAAQLARRARPLEPRHATFARLQVSDGIADQVVLTFFPAPGSYTGEDVVEISAHGSPVLLREIVRGAMSNGARLAEPGEFTLRAYLNGRVDLVQAEAVADLVDAATPLQARVAYDQLEGTLTTRIHEIDALLFDLTARLEASLDFSEEGYHFVAAGGAAEEVAAVSARLDALLATAARGRMIREGLQVALSGTPNAGKSSLFNRLVDVERAIVTPIPGTTRDLLTETVEVDGVPITFVDTAGLRAGVADPIEAEGITRADAARAVADIILVVLDRSRPLTDEDHRLLDETRGRIRVVAANKADLAPAWDVTSLDAAAIQVSALTGEGIDAVRAALVDVPGDTAPRDRVEVTNVRHADLIAKARQATGRAEAAARDGLPEELLLVDLTEARTRLEEVTGARSADDVLAAIFSRFCIGK